MMGQFAAMLADRDAGTQGPWKIFDDEGFQYDMPRIVRYGDEGMSICKAHLIGGNDPDPARANARRIARVPDMEAEIIRLRAALDKAEARKVKPLAWEGKDGYFRAHDLIGGFYEIIENDNEFYLSRLSIVGGGNQVRYPTFEAASGAANGEHASRINSTLEASQ